LPSSSSCCAKPARTVEAVWAYFAQWLGIADTVTANVSTDFAALTGSTDEAKIIGAAQKRNVISAKTERSEVKRRGIFGPDFKEEDEEQRLAEEQEGLVPEQPDGPCFR
jgi:hypothetical protein